MLRPDLVGEREAFGGYALKENGTNDFSEDLIKGGVFSMLQD